MTVRIHVADAGDVTRFVRPESIQTVVTSPPYYGLRDYGVEGQLGLEETPSLYVERLVTIFRLIHHVLKPDGTVWLNLGDSYASSGGTGYQGKHGVRAARRHTQRALLTNPEGVKPKDLLGIPWRVAFALQADGWYLRSDIIWHKPNPMPESVTDRPTKAHEYLFLLTKSPDYYYDHRAILEPFTDGRMGRDGGTKGPERNRGGRTDGLTKPSGIDPSANGGRNKRSVWTVSTKAYRGAHFATFPPELVEPCIKAGSKPGDTVLDPFGGAGTTGLVAAALGRDAVLIEINPDYAALARERIGLEAVA